MLTAHSIDEVNKPIEVLVKFIIRPRAAGAQSLRRLGCLLAGRHLFFCRSPPHGAPPRLCSCTTLAGLPLTIPCTCTAQRSSAKRRSGSSSDRL